MIIHNYLHTFIMRKRNFILGFFALLCMTAMSVVLSACGGDDGPDHNPPVDDKVASVDFTYEMEFDSQFLTLCNVSVTYTDGNGNSQTEQDTSNKWNKTVHANSVPATFKRTVNITLKDNAPTEGKFNFNLLEGYSFKTLNKNGIELTTASDHGGFTPQGLAADKLADYLVTLNNTLSQTYTVGSNGKISK